MGKIIVNNFVTMDGFYDSEAGTIDEVFKHRWSGYTSIDDYDNYNLSLLMKADALILGRKTYIGNKSYWSQIDKHSDVSNVRKELARRFKEMEKIVVGSSFETEDLSGWGEYQQIYREKYIDYLRRRKQIQDSTMLVMMSRMMWNEMLEERLIDELHLTIFPMALGKGRSVFTKKPECAFRLIKSKTYPDSGNVLNIYEIVYE